jgi:hypothetical protein
MENKFMRNIFLFIFLAFISLNLACNSSEQIVSEKVSASEMPIESAKNYNKIAADFIRKARETGDFGLNTNAENTVKKGFTKTSSIFASDFSSF